jgi:hypothetical protein
MEIRCTTCQAAIPVDDVNLEASLAKCRTCNSVFDFSGQVERGEPPSAKARRDRGEIPMPKTLVVEDRGAHLSIRRKWARGPGCFFLFFSVFWNTVVSIFLGVAFFSKGPAFPFLFLIPFVLIGLATLYAAVALLGNHTTIRVEGRRLTVTSGPIPWPGDRNVDAGALDQLFCVEYVAYIQNRVPQYRFAVEALLKDGTKLRLIKGMELADQALYLEGLLEKRLAITDRPVRGEIDGA